ncbi:MAG: response regulator [Halobacterium sp.]
MTARAHAVPDDGRIRVLHVDDDPAFSELARTFLEREADDFDVLTATSASEGLEALRERDVDCVVSDYDMPGRNGIEFLEAVREDYPNLPFILFTGKGSEEVASDAISAGVTDYLQKGTSTDQYALLANRVRNAVDRERSKRALADRNRRLETLVSNLPGVVYRCRNEPEWPMEYVGGECEELTGYPASAIEDGDVVWGEDVLHDDDHERTWNAVQDALDDRAPFEVTYRIVTREGDVKTVWERGRGIYDDGDLDAIEGFITDVTERTRRERALERATTDLDAVMATVPSLVFLHDRDGVVADANARVRDELGYDADELAGHDIESVVSTPETDADRPWRDLAPGESRDHEASVERADGSTARTAVRWRCFDRDGEKRYLAIGW